MTLDGLVRRDAERHPDRPALVDDRLRAAGRTISYADADRWVDAVAAMFVANGLAPGSLVAASLPNCVESVVGLLAAWRAGLIVAPIPAVWQSRDCVSNLPRLSPAALLATGPGAAVVLRTYGDRLGSVRHVLSFGLDLPARVGALPDLPPASADVPPVSRPVSADGPLTITMTATGRRGAPVYHVRKQSHWIAAGLSVFLEADLNDGASILSTYYPSGLVGIGAGLIPWLLTSGTLHLHDFSSVEALSSVVASADPDCIVLPAGIASSLPLPESVDGPAVVAVWKDTHDLPIASAPLPALGIDLTSLAELGFVVITRTGERPASIPLGNISSPSDDSDGAVLLETRVDASPPVRPGAPASVLFSVSGPMVPDAVRLPGNGASLTTGLIVSADHYLRTDIGCRLTDETPARATPLGRSGETITVGGLSCEATALDEVFGAMPGIETAAALVVDLGDGPELVAAIVPRAAASFVPADYLAALRESGVATHFRPRRAVAVTSIPRGSHGGILRDHVADQVKASQLPLGTEERVARAS